MFKQLGVVVLVKNVLKIVEQKYDKTVSYRQKDRQSTRLNYDYRLNEHCDHSRSLQRL